MNNPKIDPKSCRHGSAFRDGDWHMPRPAAAGPCNKGMNSRRREIDEAIVEFTESDRAGPDDPGSTIIAPRYRRRRIHRKPMADFDKSVGLEPKSETGYLERGPAQGNARTNSRRHCPITTKESNLARRIPLLRPPGFAFLQPPSLRRPVKDYTAASRNTRIPFTFNGARHLLRDEPVRAGAADIKRFEIEPAISIAQKLAVVPAKLATPKPVRAEKTPPHTPEPRRRRWIRGLKSHRCRSGLSC